MIKIKIKIIKEKFSFNFVKVSCECHYVNCNVTKNVCSPVFSGEMSDTSHCLSSGKYISKLSTVSQNKIARNTDIKCCQWRLYNVKPLICKLSSWWVRVKLASMSVYFKSKYIKCSNRIKQKQRNKLSSHKRFKHSIKVLTTWALACVHRMK